MHVPFDRRRFLHTLGAAAAAGTLPVVARAAMGPNDKFDLLIKGGEVSTRASAFAACATLASATA
jgi:hypothetical protein